MTQESDNGAGLPFCPKCGSPTSHQYNYCEHCGAPIGIPQPTVACANCGASLYSGDRFCWKCGLLTLKQRAKPALPIVVRALLAAFVLVPVIGLAFYRLWGWVSLGVGIWLLFALILS
ncbi:MAG: zinc ribbon domain-containing protein [Candidatus Bathyarchaeia archaeon]